MCKQDSSICIMLYYFLYKIQNHIKHIYRQIYNGSLDRVHNRLYCLDVSIPPSEVSDTTLRVRVRVFCRYTRDKCSALFYFHYSDVYKQSTTDNSQIYANFPHIQNVKINFHTERFFFKDKCLIYSHMGTSLKTAISNFAD